MKIAKLKESRPSQTTLALGGGETITLVYDRAVITKEWPKPGSKRIERLSQLLMSWDVTHDDGTPYQPASNLNGERAAAWAALLEELPLDVLHVVENGIWDDYYGGKPLGGGSNDG
jgi:hypothetical protein